jgi:hypothetical protein
MSRFKRFVPSEHTGTMHTIVIVGKRDTGKTVLVKDLLPHLNCSHVTVISPLEPYQSNYKQYPHITCHPEYTKEIVDDFVAKQRQQKRPSNCIVFEDCMYDSEWTKSKSIRTLFMNGRCLGARMVLAMQFPLGMPPHLRANVDYAFIFRDNIVGNRKRLYEHYCGVFPTFEAFCEALDEISAIPYACMVINNTARSNALEDIVMIYVASTEPDWRTLVRMKQASLDVIREELMQRAWHPSRLRQCLDHEEAREIFQILPYG